MARARAKALGTPASSLSPGEGDGEGSRAAVPPGAEAAAAAGRPDISFEAFGDWYNSGGFKLVPWLELLDLAKWDYAGRAAAAAAAAAHKSERHAQKKRSAAAAAAAAAETSADFMGSIAEEDMLIDPVSPSMFRSQPRPRAQGRSRTVVSFDFTGAMPTSQPFQIRITEENLSVLKDLVTRTGLSGLNPDAISSILLRHAVQGKDGKAQAMILERDAFGRCIRDIVSSEAFGRMGKGEMEMYSSFFSNLFACFDSSSSFTGAGCVNAKELAVGFSFLCAGNKSTKLATAFELLDSSTAGRLSPDGLSQYLRSYLTMLIGISLLTESNEETAATSKMLQERSRVDMFVAVENGASWTRDQFINAIEAKRGDKQSKLETASFEDFAEWYTEGGYTVAPWLELLDLTKFLSLINNNRPQQHPRRLDPVAAPQPQPKPEVMFTFPLANHQSLLVLREDATYVRSVVTQLKLSSLNPEQLWNSLFGHLKKKQLPPLPENISRKHKSGNGKSIDVNQRNFVSAMEKIIKASKRKAPARSKGDPSQKETLNNFFQSFDIRQTDRVAANELMGGLSLLCGGKKSMKLAFAFSVFDGRVDQPKGKKKRGKKDIPQPANSLDGKELFLFLRSFLIVMFSCCKQSLDLSADAVNRYIYDTAHVIAQDVMKFQWDRRKEDRVNFDEFGEWYNEGGFETAPWLELLDLNKWVFSEEDRSVPYRPSPQRRPLHESRGRKSDIAADDILCPPPPPDDVLDPHDDPFFADISMDGMDGITEMDFQMIAADMTDKENNGNTLTPRLDSIENAKTANSSGTGSRNSTSTSNKAPSQPSVAASTATQAERPPPPSMPAPRPPSQSLKFHLLTRDQNGGYLISISQRRVRHLRQLVVDSGLCKIDVAAASSRILEHAVKPASGSGSPTLNKERFDAAMRGVVGLTKSRMTADSERHLSELLTSVFLSFDRDKKDEVSALEIVAGFTVLCGGRKSDKLEFAFDLIDENDDGKLAHSEMVSYLKAFLTVLLRVSTSSALDDDEKEVALMTLKGGKCEVDDASIRRVISAGTDCATAQVYNAVPGSMVKGKSGKLEPGQMSFDDFADWYTKGGYTSIPWLELLDLRKWVLAAMP